MKSTLTVLALLALTASRSFGFGFAAEVKKLPKQELAEYQAQLPALTAAAKANTATDFTPRRVITGRLVVAPFVHSFSYQIENKKGFYHVYTDYWRFGEKGSNDFKAEQSYNALLNVVDHTYQKVTQGLKDKGYVITPAKAAVEKRGVPAKAGKPAQSVITDKAAIRSYGSYTYTYPEFNDWADLPFTTYAGVPDFQGVVFVRGSDRWDNMGEAQMNGEAVIEYNVHHRFEVKVCTGENTNCKVVRVPKNDAADLSTKLFVPSMKSVDDEKRKENNMAALKLAAQHNAEIILAALDAAMETKP